MMLFSRRRDRRRQPDGAEALLRMTPRELADLPFWVEPPQPDCVDGACVDSQPSQTRPATAAISCTACSLARPQSRRSSVSGTWSSNFPVLRF